MKFCSNCGAKVRWQVPDGDNRERAVCSACESIFYDGPRVLVTTMLYCGDKLLWTQRGIDPCKGLWAFPGGFVERDETLQQAAVRELYEETRIVLPAVDMIPMSLGSVLTINQLYIVFRCECERLLPVQCTEETINWRWCTQQQAPWDAMAHPETQPQIRQLYQWIQTGEFAIRIGEVTLDGGRYQVHPLK